MSKKRRSEGLTVDFTNTDEGGSRLPAGDYVVKVEKAEVRKGSSGFNYIAWTMKVITGEFKGKTIYHNTSLKPEALFNLRNFLIAIGVSVPKGKMTLKLKEYVGKVLGVYVEDGEYTGSDGRKKKKTEVIEMYPVEKQGKKWVKAIDDDIDDEDDDDYEDDIDDDLDDEDDDLDDEDDEDEDDTDDDDLDDEDDADDEDEDDADDEDEDDADDEDDEDEDDEDDVDDDEDDDDEDLEDELDDLLDDDDGDEDEDDDEEPTPKKSKKSSANKGKPKSAKSKGKGRMKL